MMIAGQAPAGSIPIHKTNTGDLLLECYQVSSTRMECCLLVSQHLVTGETKKHLLYANTLANMRPSKLELSRSLRMWHVNLRFTFT